MVPTAGFVSVAADLPEFNPQHPVPTDAIVATINSVWILCMRIRRESKATSSRRRAWAAEALSATTADVAAAGGIVRVIVFMLRRHLQTMYPPARTENPLIS